MKTLPPFESIRTTLAYDGFLKLLYAGVKRRVEEIDVSPLPVISVTGNEPPASKQFQGAVAALYGIAYSLKMGLKFAKLAQPVGYFDYKVGALEALWWSTGGKLDMTDPKTLRWQAYIMVPLFVSKALFERAREQAQEKHPEVRYDAVSLVTVLEGPSIQVLHLGPYDREEATVAELHGYAAEHGLAVTGKHHEIYLGDPRRTAPAKLKTVIRLGVAKG